jgi:hypothetical protein
VASRHPKARGHDGRRGDCDERAGQGFGVYSATADGCALLTRSAGELFRIRNDAPNSGDQRLELDWFDIEPVAARSRFRSGGTTLLVMPDDMRFGSRDRYRQHVVAVVLYSIRDGGIGKQIDGTRRPRQTGNRTPWDLYINAAPQTF